MVALTAWSEELRPRLGAEAVEGWSECHGDSLLCLVSVAGILTRKVEDDRELPTWRS